MFVRATTTESRYHERVRRWGAVPWGRARHLGWWWFHNAVAHPLLAALPVGPVFRLHDWASARLAGDHLPPETS